MLTSTQLAVVSHVAVFHDYGTETASHLMMLLLCSSAADALDVTLALAMSCM